MIYNKFLKTTALVTGMMFTLAACGASDDKANDQGLPAFSAERIKDHMAYLASDDMKGRDTGSEEYRMAAEYVADFYKDLGLKPAGDNGTYFQEVPFKTTRIAQEMSSLKVMDKIFAPDAVVFRTNTDSLELIANGDLVFVGYGIHAPDMGHDDFAGVDVAGKIIVRLIGLPEGIAPEIAQAYSSTQRRGLQGAKAVIDVSTPVFEETRFPFATLAGFFSGERFELVGQNAESDEAVEAAPAIEAIISAAGAQDLFAMTGSSLDAAMTEAAATGFVAKPLNVSVDMKQVTLVDTSITSPNVAAVLEGSDPVLKNQYVVISGHLDHVGDTCPHQPNDTAAEDDTICNGALDNASGTATLLEVAKAFAENATRPKRSVLFLNVTAEEKGLFGSEYYSNNPTLPVESLVANVNLDMPILFYDFADVVAFGGEHSTIGETAAKALAKINIAVAEDPMPEERLFTRSDHFRFVQKGVPAVFLMTGPTAVGDDMSLPPQEREGYKEFRKFLETNYHSPADDMNQPLMFDVAAKYALGNYLIIEALANEEQEPRWYEGNTWGDQYAPGKPRATAPAPMEAAAE